MYLCLCDRINCVGGLRLPHIPDMYRDSVFAGRIVHSAQWDTSLDLTDKRVAVVGTGASAAQIIPAIADQVRELSVFQRQAPWTVNRNNYTYSPIVKYIFEVLPIIQILYRLFLFLWHEVFFNSIFWIVWLQNYG